MDPAADRPLFVYDGDCGFCRRWVRRWETLTAGRVRFAAAQEVGERLPQIPPDQLLKTAWFVEPDGATSSGAAAVFAALRHAPGRTWLDGCYRRVPGFAPITEAGYRFVAAHRRGLSTLTTLLWGRSLQPQTFHAARWLFIQLIAAVYIIAFVSFGVQVDGLIGSSGIEPAGEFLKYVSEQIGPERYRLVPTLCWFDASDATLRAPCWGGAGVALLALFGVLTAPALLLAWSFYLSLASVAGVFLSFQWDILLLEAGFLAIFLAPVRLAPGLGRAAAPSPAALLLMRWLLFRLMFMSGLVKLLSGDEAWWNLTALTVHYQTQPLPTWTAWYAHQLPLWFQKFSCGAMFVIELAVPFLILAPRRLRHLGCALLLFLQLLIAGTGNYTFFNLLTVALCVMLLDDALLGRLMPQRLRACVIPDASSAPPGPGRVRRALVALLVLIVVPVSALQTWARISPRNIPDAGVSVLRWTQPLRSINVYGLFSIMTMTRPEIVVEGSNDLREWRAYEFRYKPGDLNRRPAFVAPHQPRLDWQMWFAALGDVRRNPWFVNFVERLLEGSPDVLALLERNPFPDSPPRYLRATLYEYRFTTPVAREISGAWWQRERLGAYLPPVSLESFGRSRNSGPSPPNR